MIAPKVLARLDKMRPIVLATILRIGRRVEEGFTGEISIGVKDGGVYFLKWIETESGNEIKEELE